MEAHLQKVWKRSYERIQMRKILHDFFNFNDFSQTYPQQNDVIRRYTEQIILHILFLATKTDHMVTRK